MKNLLLTFSRSRNARRRSPRPRDTCGPLDHCTRSHQPAATCAYRLVRL